MNLIFANSTLMDSGFQLSIFTVKVQMRQPSDFATQYIGDQSEFRLCIQDGEILWADYHLRARALLPSPV